MSNTVVHSMPFSIRLGSELDPSVLVSVGGSEIRYIASVSIGVPPTKVNLLVDTASGNTLVRETKFVPDPKKATGNDVTIKFAMNTNSFEGKEYIDTISLDSTLVVPKQSIGVGTITGLEVDIDGILGLGPAALTKETVEHKDTVPTVTDNLAALNIIPLNLIAIRHGPGLGGEVDFGVVDAQRYTGVLIYSTITTTVPWAFYWGINGLSFIYGKAAKSTVLLSNGTGFLDTGEPYFQMASSAIKLYCNITQAVVGNDGTLSIAKAKLDRLQSFFVKIDNIDFELTPDAQRWDQKDTDPVKLIIQELPKTIPGKLNLSFILGFGFLRHFYTVHDRTNNQIGFAKPK